MPRFAARLFAAFFCGLLFGFGLLVSQMSNPAKVLNFLDVSAIASGRWDPSLAFVMLGAIPVAAIGFALAKRRAGPLLGGEFHGPSRPAGLLDANLIGGAVLFGVGWGLAGFCPGPAITALGFGQSDAWLFFAAMAAGMILFNFASDLLKPKPRGDLARDAAPAE